MKTKYYLYTKPNMLYRLTKTKLEHYFPEIQEWRLSNISIDSFKYLISQPNSNYEPLANEQTQAFIKKQTKHK